MNVTQIMGLTLAAAALAGGIYMIYTYVEGIGA